MKSITDKTLVAWVLIDNLEQRGSGILTLEQFNIFDSIVFGEVRPKTWMAGSNSFERTHTEQSEWPKETVAPEELVQIAIVYKDTQVSIYRNGELYASYSINKPFTFESGMKALIGARHQTRVGDESSHFAGAVEEARIYDCALDAEVIASLKLNEPSPVKSLGMWTFEDGTARDEMEFFGKGSLYGGAEISNGKLWLNGKTAYMITPPKFQPIKRKSFPDSLEEQLNLLETEPEVRNYQEARERLASDRYRPLYHFSVPEGLMNDPNGAVFWRGRYHLFYQFVPKDANRVHWGHTVSDDLVYWRDLPIALYPDTEKDCFSGQSLVEDDRVIAIYHGTGSGNAIATSFDPLLMNWEKHPANPVIPLPPPDAPYRVFDPCIWKEEDAYYALSGSFSQGRNTVDCRNADYLFRSEDLEHWEYLHPLIEDGFFTEPGEDGAVPSFFPLGKRWMLLFFSHRRSAQYYIGDYDQKRHKFVPIKHDRINYTPTTHRNKGIGALQVGNLHAPSALLDEQGRRIIFFNMKEGKPSKGWVGMMTLPRYIWLDDKDNLHIEPVPELTKLRNENVHINGTEIPANTEIDLPSVNGNVMEIEAVFEPDNAREIGINILRSPDGTEQTTVSFYPDMTALSIDTSRSTIRSDVTSRTPEIGHFALNKGELLRLNIFIDKSIVEVFANNRQCLTVRVYPELEDSTGVSLFARRGSARLVSLNAWQMGTIW